MTSSSSIQQSKHAWYLRNKDDVQASNKRIKAEKQEFIRFQKEQPCTDCGEEYPYYVMDFDHIGKKLCEPSKLHNKSWEFILDELDKCEVVCSNCHRERSHSRLSV